MEETILYHADHPKGKPLSSLRKFHTDEQLVKAGWTEDPDNVEKVEPEKKVKVTMEQAEMATPDALVSLVKTLGYHVFTDIELQAEKNKVPPKGLTTDQVIENLKELGFNVLTDIELQSECSKAQPNDSIEILVEKVKELGFNVLTNDQLQAEVIKAGGDGGGPVDITSVTDAALAAELDRRRGNQSAAIVDSLAERFKADPKSLNKEDLVVYGKEGFGLPLKMTMKEDTLIGKINEAIAAAQ